MVVKQVIEIDVSYDGYTKQLSIPAITNYVANALGGIRVHRISVKNKRAK